MLAAAHNAAVGMSSCALGQSGMARHACVRGLRAAHNPDVTTQVLPQLNHLFQTDPAATSRYATIEETFAPSAMVVIGDWLSARTSSPGKARK